MFSKEHASEDKRRKKNRSKHYNNKSWLPTQVNLIHLISKYPVLYTPVPYRHSKLDKVTWDNAWIEVSSKLRRSKHSCTQQWSNIKHKYAKVMSLINSGKITKEIAMSHPETGKYLDGRLDFMEPYLCEITDEQRIPVLIHRLIDNMFNLKTEIPTIFKNRNVITHASVRNLLAKRTLEENEDPGDIPLDSLQTLFKLVKCKLEKSLQINNTLSNPNNDILNSDGENDDVNMIQSIDLQKVPCHKCQPNSTFKPTKDEENRSKGMDLGLQSELIIEDDVKIESNDENFMTDDVDDNIINMNVEDDTINMNVEDDTLDVNIDKINNMNDDDVNIKTKGKYSVRKENLTIDNVNNKIVKMVDLENTMPSTEIDTSVGTSSGDLDDGVSDQYIRHFFNELGVITSLELNVSKQKILQSRITELLKRLLVGDLSM